MAYGVSISWACKESFDISKAMGMCWPRREAQRGREKEMGGGEAESLRGAKSVLGEMDKWEVGSSKLTMFSMVFGITSENYSEPLISNMPRTL